MSCRFTPARGAATGLAFLLLSCVPTFAATIPASCSADFTFCAIPENTMLQLPFFAISGDAVLTDPGTTTVSDVFRIFNNIADTGLGTGLGDLAFLYSSDDGRLPAPSTYSANAVFLSENPSGFTTYLGNGTNYLLGAPEPGSLQLVLLAPSWASCAHAGGFGR